MLQSSYISAEIAEHCERHQKAKTQPSVQKYSASLRSAVDCFTKTIIIVDALDECQDDARDTVLEEVSRVQKGVSLLITWRSASVLMPLQVLTREATIDSIMAKPTIRKINPAIKDLPKEIDLMYDGAFERIKN